MLPALAKGLKEDEARVDAAALLYEAVLLLIPQLGVETGEARGEAWWRGGS